MTGPNGVRVTKIKCKKDKLGTKWATIELTHVIDGNENFSEPVRRTVEEMEANAHIKNVKLTERVGARNLVFFAAPGVPQPSETFAGVELSNFKLKREGKEDEQVFLVVSFEFTVRLEDARQWIVPAIGDDVIVVSEEAQMPLGFTDKE